VAYRMRSRKTWGNPGQELNSAVNYPSGIIRPRELSIVEATGANGWPSRLRISIVPDAYLAIPFNTGLFRDLQRVCRIGQL
jgi:hypothetical protein